MYKEARKLEDLARKAEFGEVYGRVIKSVGCRRFQVTCQIPERPNDLKEMVCTLKGSCRKMVRSGMYVLVTVFDFNENQGQIIDVFTDGDVQALRKAKLWDMAKVGDDDTNETGDMQFNVEEATPEPQRLPEDSEESASDTEANSEGDIDLI